MRQRNEGQNWGGGWGEGVRDAERERAIWRREKEEEGRKASDGDGCSMVLDAAERRRGREERVGSARAFAAGTRVTDK